MRPQSTKTASIPLEEAPTDLDLSPWTGVPETAPKRAGDARAAQVAALRRIRDEKLYMGLTSTWEEFCEKHLLISRRSVDRSIRRLKEFGSVFFRLAEAVPIASGEYRLIRGHVCPEGVRFEGEVIGFDGPQRQRLPQIITELLRRTGPKPARQTGEPFPHVVGRLEAAAKMLERYERSLDRVQKFELAAVLGRALRRGLQLGVRPA
jgi:hypothetical protein